MAAEIARLLREETVRDRENGRAAARLGPGDIAILFRSRESHREFEHALERRGIPVLRLQGLGFFDADEIKDVSALLWYLADPASDLRAAAFLRSRFVRISDEALALLAPRSGRRAHRSAAARRCAALDDDDRRVLRARARARAAMAAPGRSHAAGGTLDQLLRRPRTPSSCAARAASRRGRTSRRCAA